MSQIQKNKILISVFPINTGATCNVIKLNKLVGMKYMTKMKKTKQVLKMYNSSTLKPIRQCTVQLQNPETHKKYRVKFTVIDGENCTNLLGNRAAQQKGLVNYDNMKILTEPGEMTVAAMTASEPSLTEDSMPKQTVLTMITKEYKDVFRGWASSDQTFIWKLMRM